MAWFLNGDLFTWRSRSTFTGISITKCTDLTRAIVSNDSDGNAVLVSMFGTALLASIDILISRDLFDNNSELRNIGLVLAKFIKFATEVGDDELCRSGENKWKKAVIRLVNEHGIFLYGVSGIRDIEDAIKDSIGDDDSDESEGPLVLKPGFYGVITADSFYRPTKKSWESPNWKKEVRSPFQHELAHAPWLTVHSLPHTPRIMAWATRMYAWWRTRALSPGALGRPSRWLVVIDSISRRCLRWLRRGLDLALKRSRWGLHYGNEVTETHCGPEGSCVHTRVFRRIKKFPYRERARKQYTYFAHIESGRLGVRNWNMTKVFFSRFTF